MTTSPTLDFNWCIEYLERHGRATLGPRFRIHGIDHDAIYRLLVYFLRLEGGAARLGIDLGKGVLLSGPVGCGKSALMALMATVLGPGHRFVVRACRDVSFEFADEGFKVIARYSKLSFNERGARTYCFDDLGSEQNIKHFGNECNVMGEILLSRYDLFGCRGMLTHLTTNLSAADIESAYGNRVRSRLREQLNLFAFAADSPDKRV